MPDGEREQIENNIKQYWDITDIKVITFDEFKKYKESPKGYNFISIGFSFVNSNTTYFYLNVWKQKENKKKESPIGFARWYLFYDWGEAQTPINIVKKNGKKIIIEDIVNESDLQENIEKINSDDITAIEFLNSSPKYLNWFPGNILNHIKELNRLLTENVKQNRFKKVEKEKELSRLQNEILYIPEYVFTNYNPKKWKNEETLNVKSIFEKYKYKYKVVSNKELNSMIIEGKEFLYLEISKNSNTLTTNVINSTTSEFIYTKHSPITYRIDGYTIEKLYESIKKSSN